jgi:hypothetical protein
LYIETTCMANPPPGRKRNSRLNLKYRQRTKI